MTYQKLEDAKKLDGRIMDLLYIKDYPFIIDNGSIKFYNEQNPERMIDINPIIQDAKEKIRELIVAEVDYLNQEFDKL